jgi:hypothetical protein
MREWKALTQQLHCLALFFSLLASAPALSTSSNFSHCLVCIWQLVH